MSNSADAKEKTEKKDGAPMPEVVLENAKKEFSEFGVYPNTDYTLIRMNQNLTNPACEALENKIKIGEKEVPPHYIFDCSAMGEVNPNWIRFCLQLRKKLEASQRKMRLVNVNERLLTFIKAQGLNGSLQVCSDLETALDELAIKKKSKGLDVGLVNPFIVAAIHTIKTYTNSESKQGQTFVRPCSPTFAGEVSGILPIDCAGFQGLFVISFEPQTIMKITSKMLGGEFNKVDEMVLSSVGELGNIVFAQGRKSLNEAGYGISPALPKIAPTKDVPPEFIAYRGASVVVPFETDFGKFFAEIRMK